MLYGITIAEAVRKEHVRGGKTVVFLYTGQEVTDLEYLLSDLSPKRISGSTPSEIRAAVIHDYQTEKGPRILIGTYATLSTGVNLDATTFCVMGLCPWECDSANKLQAMARVDRLASTLEISQ